MNDLEKYDSRLEKVESRFKDIQDELLEINQSRTPFQLVHFVVQRHGPLEAGAGPRQRYQALRELHVMRGEMARQILKQRRLSREIDFLREGKSSDGHDLTQANNFADLEIAEKAIELADLEVNLKGLFREFDTLCQILDALPKYTYEQFQELEPLYWRQRLERQAVQSRTSVVTGYDRGDIESLAQATDEEILPGVGRVDQIGFPIPGITQPVDEILPIYPSSQDPPKLPEGE
jgi:hypothetical protein